MAHDPCSTRSRDESCETPLEHGAMVMHESIIMVPELSELSKPGQKISQASYATKIRVILLNAILLSGAGVIAKG